MKGKVGFLIVEEIYHVEVYFSISTCWPTFYALLEQCVCYVARIFNRIIILITYNRGSIGEFSNS